MVRHWNRCVEQRRCGCPKPGSVQGQVGWNLEQPGPLEGIPTHDRGFGTRWSRKSFQPKLCCDSVTTVLIPTWFWLLASCNQNMSLISQMRWALENFTLKGMSRLGDYGEFFERCGCIPKPLGLLTTFYHSGDDGEQCWVTGSTGDPSDLNLLRWGRESNVILQNERVKLRAASALCHWWEHEVLLGHLFVVLCWADSAFQSSTHQFTIFLTLANFPRQFDEYNHRSKEQQG